jgi:hypothetical protein
MVEEPKRKNISKNILGSPRRGEEFLAVAVIEKTLTGYLI